MSITKAMYSGVSGLVAESDTLSIVGENVANTNTIGFKKSRATFESVLGGAVGAQQTGGGVRLGRAQQIFAQGALVSTGNATDLAISGDGFFVVQGTVNGVHGDFYTRAGQLTVNNEGKLVNMGGLAIQGYAANGDGTFTSSVGTLQLSTAQLPPRPTGAMTLTANLDAGATAPGAAFDAQSPGDTSNLSTSMTVYDSLGQAHAVDVHFRKGTNPGEWEVHVLAKGDELAGGAPGQNVEIGTGTLTFNPSGALQDVQWATPISASFTGAKANQAISVDFGQPIAAGGTGLGGTTQFGSNSAISAQSQDGYASGDLSGVKIDSDGVVSGVYSNGQTVAAGKLAIAKFRSNDGLAKAGSNVWTATRASGEAALGAAGEGGRGALVSGALEQSNVDIAEQFVDLIAHQRAFQANSKTITTADQMLQELMMIKQ
ncbi:MAG: flagellar hook protein FlgE [Labilithrix sp.]|nr:flagellar hook protein FlgE [Labilithrix sp.]MCW5817154.1 flagellar hook protein FlgE [Labilithrix sp.]